MIEKVQNAFNATIAKLEAGYGDAPVGSMPLEVGQKLTFANDENTIVEQTFTDRQTKKVRSYGVFNTKEGYPISFSQICRKGNGLNLIGATRKEMLMSFADKITEDGNFAIVVDDVIKIPSSFNEGKQTFLKFRYA